jgi:glycosyltransferase involved in cell wall biosynthesis
MDRVTFLGTVPDAGSYYAAFDIFVLSSHSEGTPITIFEAMAARVPIVATRVGGVPDVLDQTDASLVEPGQPPALAAAIDALLLADPETRAHLAARAAQRLVSHYGLEPWLDAHELVYRSLSSPERTPEHPAGRREAEAL